MIFKLTEDIPNRRPEFCEAMPILIINKNIAYYVVALIGEFSRNLLVSAFHQASLLLIILLLPIFDGKNDVLIELL